MDGSDTMNVTNKIRVFSSDDERLKLLGELLSNKSSRDIMRLLTEKESYINEIAETLDLRTSLVIHHLKKMEELGMVEITMKKLVKKGIGHKFYRVVPNLLIIVSRAEKEEPQEKILKRILKQGIKFGAIGAASLASWILLYRLPDPRAQIGSEHLTAAESVIPSMVIIIVGLIIERIFAIKKAKRT